MKETVKKLAIILFSSAQFADMFITLMIYAGNEPPTKGLLLNGLLAGLGFYFLFERNVKWKNE